MCKVKLYVRMCVYVYMYLCVHIRYTPASKDMDINVCIQVSMYIYRRVCTHIEGCVRTWVSV